MADEILNEIKGLGADIKTLSTKADEAKLIAEKSTQKTVELAAQLKELNDDKTENMAWKQELKTEREENQKALNNLIIEMKTIREGGVTVKPGQSMDFESSLAKAIGENFQVKDDKGRMSGVSTVTKGSAFGFDLDKGTGLYTKAAANMTTSGNLTGSPNITYVPQPVLFPRQLVNFRDLVPSFQSQTGLIAIFRENGSGTTPEEGGFGQQTTQGALKEQVGYDFTNVQFTATYLAGFVRISKQMLQDLLFLQTYLPQMLLRDYFKFENATFYAAQVAAALGTHSAGGNAGETFIKDAALLETSNFSPNGIVIPPLIWANLMMDRVPTTGTSYSNPGGIYINPNTGQAEIAGLPVIKANWITANTGLIADWSQSQVAQVDGLRVEFFEQDSDNVQRNLITVRCECRCVLVTGQPYAFTNMTSGLGTGA